MRSNFTHLVPLSAELAKIGCQAERYFADDPNTTLLKLRQFGELLAQELAARFGLRLGDVPDNQFETRLEIP